MGRWMNQERGTCPECGREVATYIPKQGDGSERVAYRHNANGKRCNGGRFEVPDVSYGNPWRRDVAQDVQREPA